MKSNITKQVIFAGVLFLFVSIVGIASRASAVGSLPTPATLMGDQERRDRDNRDNDEGRWRRSRAFRRGFDLGRRAGQERGRDDARGRRNADPDNDEHFRDIDRWHRNNEGPVEAFRLGYREGFRRGYNDTFRRYHRR